MTETTETTTTRVDRETVVDADLDQAWEAISDPGVLSEWLADEVELEAVEGAPATFVVDGEERPARIERVDEGRELSFTWEREEGRASLVELQLTPCYRGVRVSVRETDLGGGPTGLAMSWAGPMLRLHSLRVPAFA